MSNADVFVVVRQLDGGRNTIAFKGAVYDTHRSAINAMNNHKDALRKYSKSDASNVFIKKTSNPRRIR